MLQSTWLCWAACGKITATGRGLTAESGDGQVEIEDGPSLGPSSWLHCPGHPLRHTVKAVRLGRPLYPALSLVVRESVFVGIYLHCNQNTCFGMFGFIWVGCKSLLFFLCFWTENEASKWQLKGFILEVVKMKCSIMLESIYLWNLKTKLQYF